MDENGKRRAEREKAERWAMDGGGPGTGTRAGVEARGTSAGRDREVQGCWICMGVDVRGTGTRAGVEALGTSAG